MNTWIAETMQNAVIETSTIETMQIKILVDDS